VYTWTPEKNQINKRKHGIYLSEVVDVFDDPHLLEWYDAVHSADEDRYITIGRLYGRVIFWVVTTDKANDEVCLIMARKATSKEQEAYNEHYRRETAGDRGVC
jgi:uncharacterized DUF497 family protein